MLKKSPIFHLVYFTLTSSELISSTITKENIENEKENLFNLWDFTEELVYGINELAKNIIQHTITKQGVITGYINDKELNLSVFDHSNKGVLNTLLKSTENTFKKLNSTSVLKRIFKEDLDKIKSNKFKFHNLFEANNDNFLNQQTKRATAHLGLLIFSKLISENNGRFYTHSYNANSNKIDEYSNNKSTNISIPLGTGYEILLPLELEGENKREYYNKRISPTSRGIKDKISIEKLLKFKEIKLPQDISSVHGTLKNNYVINIFLQDNSFSYREFEDEIWNEAYIYFKLIGISDIKDGNSVICLNFNEVQRINASQLFRFLGKWEIENPTINLIIYNIHTELYYDLIKINRSFLSIINGISYWNSDALTLIYSFEELEHLRRFYFTDVLWGQKQEDFFYINSLIKNNNYNALYYHPKFDSEKNYKSSLVANNMFYDGLTLLPFDLLIRDITNTSLFEYNSKALLCNELKIQIENPDDNELKKSGNLPEIAYIKNEIKNLPGFKIADSHFKLGSKIHITDFYYAKRFFQNSFYASRFAFIIAKYIYEKHLNKIGSNDRPYNLTIIGYGVYSELLLSLIVNFIKKLYKKEDKKININHNLFNDVEELKLVKGYDNIYKNIIILVPIATTFSTSMKIEEEIQRERKTEKLNVLEHINSLVVSDGEMSDKSTIYEKDIEFNYGWKKVSNKDKTVDVSSFFNQNVIRKQKYFLSLPSKWFSIKNCEKCFPKDINSECILKECNNCNDYKKDNKCPLSEKPLLTTDKTSVTPSLIFDFPKARKISETENNLFDLSSKALEYGHTIRNNNHFHYHIYDEIFYEENEEKVQRWINDNVRKQFKEESGINYSEIDNILIIAPKHFSNTVFINIVNEILFANSANILHYDFWKNNIENFQIFYQDAVRKANKIIFVDDTIISGSTFFRSNNFLKHTRDDNYGFDACIFLINRINSFTKKNIIDELDNGIRFFSFANLHLPALKDNGSDCQLCVDKKRAEILFEESFLDRFKDSYYQRILKLTSKDVSFNSLKKETKKGYFYDKKNDLRKVEAIHRLYEYFLLERNKEFFISTEDFKNWQYDLLDKTHSPLEEVLMTKTLINKNTVALLKVLAYPPFNIYRPIKEKVFKWTNSLLNDQIEKIKNGNYNNFDYQDFRDLKFLIRRAGLINSNFLISERFLEFIIKLYIGGKLEKIKAESSNLYDKHKNIIQKDAFYDLEMLNSIIENIDDFTTYIVVQIKELIFKNEAMSILY